MFKQMNKIVFHSIVVIGLVLAMGCGKKEQPLPPPPPPPPTPANGGGGMIGGACGNIGPTGAPLSQTPYQLKLISQGGNTYQFSDGPYQQGFGENSLQLELRYVQQYAEVGQQAYRIAGTGRLFFPDIQRWGVQTNSVEFCVATSNQNNTPNPGIYYPQNGQIQLSLLGRFQTTSFQLDGTRLNTVGFINVNIGQQGGAGITNINGIPSLQGTAIIDVNVQNSTGSGGYPYDPFGGSQGGTYPYNQYPNNQYPNNQYPYNQYPTGGGGTYPYGGGSYY